MKREFKRGKRITSDYFAPLQIKVEKRTTKTSMGIAQTLINIIVFVLIFAVFFKNNLQFMGLFIAFMVASVIAQLVIRFGKSIKFIKRFPFIMFIRDVKQYKKYLSSIESTIDKYCDDYSEYLSSNLFNMPQLKNCVENMLPQLWSRIPSNHDFLMLNLGETNSSYPIEIALPTFTYNEKDAILEDFSRRIDLKIKNQDIPNPKQFNENIYNCKKLPFGFSLLNERVISLANKGLSENEFCNVVNALILDLTVMQSYEELGICTIFNNNFRFEWVRYLPHSWVDNRRLVYCASEEESEFERLFLDTINQQSKHIVAVIDADFLQKSSLYSFFNNESLPEKLSVVFFSYTGLVPSRAKRFVDYQKKDEIIYARYEKYELVSNMINEETCESIAKKLFNINLVDNHTISSSDIPEELTLFELFNTHIAERLPTATEIDNAKIQEYFPIDIGTGINKSTVSIDLTNDGDGNHCLVTGTTGSGKSEFLLTYIITACAKYSPDFFSFAVIDFSGGAMSDRVKYLPHCVGEFTNTSGDVTKRELTRIAKLLESEINYRVQLLKDLDCKSYAEYHQKYANKETEIPLPRLLIVVDEVAVFFSIDNTAVSYITLIATVGRKYGMILFLATQSKDGGIIPQQVKTNINVHVEFYSEDDAKKGMRRIKGRATINSNKKTDVYCQVALSSVYDSNLVPIDFLTMSGKERILKGMERHTQFDQVFSQIGTWYPWENYSKIYKVIIEPLESIITDGIALSELQTLHFAKNVPNKLSFPIGMQDNIYERKRQAFSFALSKYNLLIYGKPQTGKTTFIKTLLDSLFDKKYGLRPNELSVYIVAKNSLDYADYQYPHIGSVLAEMDLYYLLLFLTRELNRRIKQIDSTGFMPILAIIDDCYSLIQQSEELSTMLSDITSKSVQYGVTIVITTGFKAGFNSFALRDFGSVISFYMGDDFDYSSLMTQKQLSDIKKLPNIPGRCFVAINEDSSKTLETQIALHCPDDKVKELSKTYCESWSGKNIPLSVPLMPEIVTFELPKSETMIPVGKAKNLTTSCWNLELVNSYLISYFSNGDDVPLLLYLTKVFSNLGFKVIVADNRRASLFQTKSMKNVEYCGFGDKILEEKLSKLKESDDHRLKSMLIMPECVRSLFPFGAEEYNLVKNIADLIENRRYKFYGVFSDTRDYINSARISQTKLVQYLEGVDSGMLIGNIPSKHSFGASRLGTIEEAKAIDIAWGINVSPSTNDTVRVKIATEVK